MTWQFKVFPSYLCTSLKPFKISLWYPWSRVVMIYYHTCVINYATDYKYYILYLQILLLFDSILSKTPFTQFAASQSKISTPRSIWSVSARVQICDLPTPCVTNSSVRLALTLTLSIISNKCEVLVVPVCSPSPGKQRRELVWSLPSLFPEGSHNGFSTPTHGHNIKDPVHSLLCSLPAVWPPANHLTSMRLWSPSQ